MKSVKLSLATIVAAGALASVASATPLEQAIKDVDVSGFAFLRYDTSTQRNDANNLAAADNLGVRNDGKSGSSFWKFKAVTNFKFAIDDNFYALLGLRYENRDHSFDFGGARGGVTAFNKRNNVKDGAHDDTLDVYQYALGYKIGNTDILVGRQVVGSFLTADMAGTGIKVVNKDITGLTLTGAFFDALEDDGDIGSTGWGKVVNGDKFIYQQNLYTVQVNGSYAPVDFAVWYAYVSSVASLYGVDLAAFFDINDNFGLGAHGQFAASTVTNSFKEDVEGAFNDEAVSTNYWALEANAKAFGLDLNAGYLQYGKKDGYSLITIEDNGNIIKPGEDLIDTTAFNGKHSYWFVTAKYTFLEKYSIGADFVSGKTKLDMNAAEGDIKQWESVVRLGYKHNKKLSFFGWWSHVSEKDEANQADEVKYNNDHFRFQATYKF